MLWIENRSNLALAGEHRVTVNFVNQTVSYPADFGEAMKANGKFIVVDHVWTGTVTANEVTFKVKTDDKPKQDAGDKKDAPMQAKKQEGGKEVKGLVALAELVEKPDKGLFEVRMSLKNVSKEAITICDCYLFEQVQVEWIGPDGKKQSSKHNYDNNGNFRMIKDYFVAIQPGEERHIVPTIRFHTSTDKQVNEPVRKDLGYREQLDQYVSGDRSNLAGTGEHRVTVSFNNVTVGYPVGFEPGGRPGPIQAVENVWTGTVSAREVAFKVK